MQKTLWMVVLALWMAIPTTAQEVLEREPGFQRAGKFWFKWGYNRSSYNDSDIHFKGKGYDFTLYDVRAHDMPEPFDAKIYLHPLKLTIPQFNCRVGFFLNERFSVSAGWDHMKYRLADDQRLRISGTIEPGASEFYAGTYDQDILYMTRDFLRYEHSDGFNFVRIGAEYFHPVWANKKQTVEASLKVGAYVGAMFPWTDVRLFGNYSRNWIHLAGYGLSTVSGWRVDFLKHFFIEAQAQYGWSHLSDVLLEGNSDARADQKIVFFERSLTLGGTFRLGGLGDRLISD